MDHVVVFAYFAGMIGVGWWGLRRARGKEDFLVAGRRLGGWMYFGTLSAVVLGGASTIGGVALGFQHGLSGAWLVLILGLGIIALSLLVAKRLTRLGVYTVSEMLELRYDSNARLVTAVVMTAYDLMLTVTSTIAIGTVFDVLLGIPPVPAIALGGSIVVIYSVLGGMWSITLTDIIQFAIMTVGIFFVLLPLGLAKVGGWGELTEQLPASYFEPTSIGTSTIITFALIYFLGILIGQDIWQRVFTARNAQVARRAGLASGLYCIGYALAGAIVGACAKVLFPNLAVADNAFAVIVRDILPVGLRGLVLAAALAAIMSTASACLLASSTLVAEDLHPRFIGGLARAGVGAEHGPDTGDVNRSRVYTLVLGAVAVGVACVVQDVVGALTVAYNILVGGLLVPILGALFWRRATSAGALAATAVGGVVTVTLMVTQGLLANGPIYFGLLASVATYVVVSLLTPAPDAALLARWEDRLRGGPSESGAASADTVTTR